LAVSAKGCVECTGEELLLTLALTAEQHAPFGIWIMFDPFDPAAAREKFLHGFDTGAGLHGFNVGFGRGHFIVPLCLVGVQEVVSLKASQCDGHHVVIEFIGKLKPESAIASGRFLVAVAI
jgi:hypothetical protein